jgi:NADPH:quinone reductase-like Zn-dependent oxidoreductase
MKAVVIREHGGIDKLLYEDVDKPTPGPGEVLVKIGASGVNHLDHDLREGIAGFEVALPLVMGVEGVGEVVELGAGVLSANIGDRVAIDFPQGDPQSNMWLSGLDGVDFTHGRIGVTQWGCHAEYTRCLATSLMPLPDGLSYEKAAASIVGFGTSWHMAVTLGEVRADKTVLVNAAGSVVGTSAIQVAKLHGARVIASAGSDAKLEKAKELGADEVINYTTQSIRDEVARLTDGFGVDLVIESVGGDVLVQSIDAVCENGRLITCGAHAGEIVPINIIELFRKHMMLHGSHFAGRREVSHVLKLVAEGKLNPVMNAVLPFSEVREAARKTAERDVFGKMVLVP